MDSKKLIKFLAIESRFIESKMRNEIMMFKTSGALKKYRMCFTDFTYWY